MIVYEVFFTTQSSLNHYLSRVPGTITFPEFLESLPVRSSQSHLRHNYTYTCMYAALYAVYCYLCSGEPRDNQSGYIQVC